MIAGRVERAAGPSLWPDGLRWRAVSRLVAMALLLGAGGGLHLVATEVAWKTFVSPLNVPAWQTLVTIQTGGNSGGSGGSDVVSGPDLLALRQAALPDVVAIGGFSAGRMSLTGPEVSESIDLLRVTAGVFEAAGVVPRAGHHFSEDDEAPGFLVRPGFPAPSRSRPPASRGWSRIRW